jgi:hypothetical protein
MESGRQQPPSRQTTSTALVPRRRKHHEQDHKDREVLAWLARFRFVTDELLADHFDVSRQRMNVRTRRLAHAGLVQRHDDGPTDRHLISITRRGADALGLPRRKPPRTDAQRTHELALVALVSRLERATSNETTLTEREMRQRQTATQDQYSVLVTQPGRPPARRWPDVAIHHADGRRTAIELELTGKGTTRLGRIVAAYAATTLYDEVVFLAADAPIARRLTAAIQANKLHLPPQLTAARPMTALRVEPWHPAATG